MIKFHFVSRRGGLEVECLLHNLHDSTSVGLNPARRQKDIHINIVFVWSQYDGGNIDKEQWLRFPPKPNEAKLNIMDGDLFWIVYNSNSNSTGGALVNNE